MSPRCKLTYFNFTGLGEPIRYMLSYGNMQFEDSRFEMGDWPKLKSSTPFGQVPVLEIDGKTVNQSSAICRYLAKKFGIAGDGDWDALQADVAVDNITDLRLMYSAYFKEQNEEAKAKRMQDIKSVHNPFYLSKFEEQVKKNRGHFVNGQLTWADIYFAAIIEFMSNVTQQKLLDDYPALKALAEKVEALDGIRAYRQKRPKVAF